MLHPRTRGDGGPSGGRLHPSPSEISNKTNSRAAPRGFHLPLGSNHCRYVGHHQPSHSANCCRAPDSLCTVERVKRRIKTISRTRIHRHTVMLGWCCNHRAVGSSQPRRTYHAPNLPASLQPSENAMLNLAAATHCTKKPWPKSSECNATDRES